MNMNLCPKNRLSRFLRLAAPVVAVLLLALLALPGRAADEDWEARYYNNTELRGDPVVRRSEDALDHDWGGGSPHERVDDDNFSARWTRTVTFPAGTYRFTATMDDGMRVYVDGERIIDVWYDSQVHTVVADKALSAGDHELRVEYYEKGGNAVAKLSWGGAPAAPASPPAAGDGPGWRGVYYNNTDLAGTPVLERTDPRLDFIWGTASPAPNVVNADRFSARWTGTLTLDPGRYVFTTRTDDGARLWVNNQLIVDDWNVQPLTSNGAAIDLPGGPVPVRVEYFEYTGLAEVHLSWERSGAGSAQATPQPGTDSSAAPGTAVMDGANFLSVRRGPGLDFEAFTYLSRDQVVPLLGRDGSGVWIQVELPGGGSGWVSGRYLSSGTDFGTLPVTG